MPLSFLNEAGGLRPERITELAAQGLLQRASEGRVEVLNTVRAAVISRVNVNQVRAAHLALARFYGRSHRTESVREQFLHLVAAESWRLAGELLTRQESILLASGYSDAVRNGLAQLTVSGPQESVRIRALRTQAQLLRVHSEWNEAIACLQTAVTESRKDPRVQAECLLSMIEPYCRLLKIEEAQLALDRARSVAPATHRLQEFLMHCEARILEAQGNLPKAQELYTQVFQSATKSSHTDLALEALARWSRLASLTVEEHGMGPLIDVGIREARNSGRMDIVFSLMSARARRLALLGQNEAAMSEMNLIRGEADALGYLTQLVHALSGLAALSVEMKRWEEASASARQASELAARLGNDTIRGYTLSIQCASDLRQSRLTEAKAHGELAVQILSRLPPSDSLPMAHAYLAEAYLESGEIIPAQSNYDRAVAISEKLGMNWWRKQVEAELGPKIHPSAEKRAEV
ncbi:MAG: tetratricopeptide repeat protein, partial [Thermoplasmata archaeon]